MTNNNHQDNFEYEKITVENAADHLAVLTLGGLTPEEEAELEQLIANDPELAVELQEFSEVTDSLAFLGEPIKVSQPVEEMLFKRVEANAQARFKISPSSTQIFKARIPKEKPKLTLIGWIETLFPRPVFGAAIAASLLILAGLTGLLGARLSTQSEQLAVLQSDLNSSQQEVAQVQSDLATVNQELDEANGFVDAYVAQLTEVLQENESLTEAVAATELSRDEIATQVAALLEENETLSGRNVTFEERIAEQQQVLDLFSSVEAQTIEIGGTETSPDAKATIVFDPNADVAILLVNDLPQLENDEVYQVLLVRGSEHDTAETFTVDAGGENILVVQSPSPMSIFDTVGVSIEPEGGSPQRTGEIVLLGGIVNQN